MIKLFFSALFFISITASSQIQVPEEAQIFYNKVTTFLKPAYKEVAMKKTAELKGRNIDSDSLVVALHSIPEFSSLGNYDIMALAFIIMMESAKSNEEDLKNVMADVKQINDEKQKLRSLQNKNQQNKESIQKNITTNQVIVMRSDSLYQLKQAVLTDSRSKSITALSNLLKEIASTEEQIISNLK